MHKKCEPQWKCACEWHLVQIGAVYINFIRHFLLFILRVSDVIRLPWNVDIVVCRVLINTNDYYFAVCKVNLWTASAHVSPS